MPKLIEGLADIEKSTGTVFLFFKGCFNSMTDGGALAGWWSVYGEIQIGDQVDCLRTFRR
jgi:hypothetical protein